jgi:hypothetical protein
MMTLQQIIERNITTCNNPVNRVITECEFYAPDDKHLEIWIRSDYSGWCEDVKCIGTYELGCADCCTFVSNDFIGLTEEQAKDMICMSLLHTDFIMLGNTLWDMSEFE